MEPTTLLIVAAVAIGVAWVAFKIIAGIVKFAAMAAIVLLAIAMFVPSFRQTLTDKLNGGLKDQVVSLQANACKDKGLAPAQCEKARKELAKKIETDCHGATHNWKSCGAEMKAASAWINMACMKRPQVADDCVEAVLKRLRDSVKA